MKGFFRMEGPFFDGLSRMADLVMLNLLFVVCCIPIVTAGAALTALSYVMLKMKEKEEGYVLRSFLRSFKQNFRQATLIWIGMLAVALILFIDARMLQLLGGPMQSVMRIMIFAACFIWVIEFLYVFPLLSRFENTVRQTVVNALLLAIANVPRTVLLMLVVAAAVAITFFNYMTIAYGILAWIMIGFALVSWINAAILSPIFRKLYPVVAAAGEDEESAAAGEDGEAAAAGEDEEAGEISERGELPETGEKVLDDLSGTSGP